MAVILEFEISEKLPVEWTKVFMGAVGLGGRVELCKNHAKTEWHDSC